MKNSQGNFLIKYLVFSFLLCLNLKNGSAQKVSEQNTITQNKKKPNFVANSVLASGNWFKIATTQNGIYRIDPTLLKSMGFNIDQLDPRNF
jgi:hypothetical protein